MQLNIGNTTLVRLRTDRRIFVKLEYMNPTGSIKDRAAFFMIKDALNKGNLKQGGTLVEATSGNTGIGLVYTGRFFNIRTILVMPDFISEEKIALLKTLGAEVVLTEGSAGMSGAVLKARQIAENENAFMPDQFSNPANVLAHKLGTGPEILKQMSLDIDAFVSGVGSGGTITGVSAALTEFNNKIKTFAVEPAESNVLSGGKPGKHTIEGIGAGFVPAIFNYDLISGVITVPQEMAWKEARRLAREDGVCGGPSTGANIYAARLVAEKYSFERVVTVAPDGLNRYGKEFAAFK